MQVAQCLPSFNFKANSVSKKHKSFLTVSELLSHSLLQCVESILMLIKKAKSKYFFFKSCCFSFGKYFSCATSAAWGYLSKMSVCMEVIIK